ncbi:hypothetical protein AB0A76_33075 [Streptomyces exfoliatus]|uniref:Uncharacterized protein n=1 Tax=Streptomyces exfoliatus TaxID=1905 RepID=A0ABV3D677_STREX
MGDAENWRTHWTTYEAADTDRGIVGDACNGIRLITETGAKDPVETIALPIAGAEDAEGLPEALAGEWALYTPEQLTATASAVFSQLEGVAANLHALKATLERMEARRATAFTGTARDRLTARFRMATSVRARLPRIMVASARTTKVGVRRVLT